ncbi:chemotaxis protein CheX [Glaciecola petra]|uniref:Chemotaxis protein CheX n=1 Tax=Glaciecola petra TaxID=3075602 RepID=A0ABU2ZVC5_9ALTE|nr:chemotaxis protein CheX [Aestuariibacter sp. P117]MDT0596186.1 chemotaxis protein CheX [Aestuariibacter sp. P117]
MNVEFINPFILSLQNVVQTMAQIELRAEKPEKKVDETAKGEVSGIIGMIGPQIKGSLAITFDKKLAQNMMLNMLGESSDTIDDDMRDLVGEMTNMLCGGAKSLLAEQNYQFNMATPVIVSGERHIIQHKVDGPKILLQFTSDKGNAYLEICFDS